MSTIKSAFGEILSSLKKVFLDGLKIWLEKTCLKLPYKNDLKRANV